MIVLTKQECKRKKVKAERDSTIKQKARQQTESQKFFFFLQFHLQVIRPHLDRREPINPR